MEAVETNLFGSLVEGFVEINHIGFTIALILEVVVDTVETQVKQSIQQGIDIPERTIFVFFRNEFDVFTRVYAPAFEELDTREHVGTVLVSGIGPRTGSLQNTVVPGTVQIGVVPHGVHVVVEFGTGITTNQVALTGRNVHPQATGGIHTFYDVFGGILHDGGRTHVRARELQVEIETGSFKLFGGRILAPLVCRIGKKFEQRFVVPWSKVKKIGRCRRRVFHLLSLHIHSQAQKQSRTKYSKLLHDKNIKKISN